MNKKKKKKTQVASSCATVVSLNWTRRFQENIFSFWLRSAAYSAVFPPCLLIIDKWLLTLRNLVVKNITKTKGKLHSYQSCPE